MKKKTPALLVCFILAALMLFGSSAEIIAATVNARNVNEDISFYMGEGINPDEEENDFSIEGTDILDGSILIPGTPSNPEFNGSDSIFDVSDPLFNRPDIINPGAVDSTRRELDGSTLTPSYSYEHEMLITEPIIPPEILAVLTPEEIANIMPVLDPVHIFDLIPDLINQSQEIGNVLDIGEADFTLFHDMSRMPMFDPIINEGALTESGTTDGIMPFIEETLPNYAQGTITETHDNVAHSQGFVTIVYHGNGHTSGWVRKAMASAPPVIHSLVQPQCSGQDFHSAAGGMVRVVFSLRDLLPNSIHL